MNDPRRCNHVWERRADLDARSFCRFRCRECGVLGRSFRSPSAPIRAYDERHTSLPSDADFDALLQRRVFTNRYGLPQWFGLAMEDG
jgi:hypothetical protein